ncbi:hypothetical protein ACHAXT_002987 [Thalassiosira profunda]
MISISIAISLIVPALCRAVVNVSTCVEEPWGRYSHVGEWNSDGTAFYSFSGDTTSASDGRGGVVRTNWKYDIETSCWTQMPSPEVAVGYRGTAVRLGDDGIVVLAGADSSYAAVDHFWRFDGETEQFEDIGDQYPGGPSARYKHAAIAIQDGKTMLVTGGRQDDTVLSDIWTFSFASGWEEIRSEGFEGEALYRHSMAWDPDTQSVWAFGGLDGNFNRKGELWRADANDLASGFTKVDGSAWEVAPSKSASLGMSYFGGKVYIWGGTCNDDSTLFAYTVANNTWCKVPTVDDSDGYSRPSRRDAFVWLPRFYYEGDSSSHSFIQSNRTEHKLEVFVAGGDVICAYGGQRAYTVMDVWRLSIEEDNAEWSLIYRPKTARDPSHADAICGDVQRTSCRAAVSIEEDLATTGRPSGEDGMGGQCGATDDIDSDAAKAGSNVGESVSSGCDRSGETVATALPLASWYSCVISGALLVAIQTILM